MTRGVVLVSKFLSVAGLGLLSSSALTLSLATLPALLCLPSTSDALPAFYRLKQHLAAAHRLLAVSTGTLLATSYLLSPRFARHPFLLYMGVTTALGTFGVPRILGVQELDTLDEVGLAEEGRGRTGSEMNINGEIIRESVESWKRALGWQSFVWGAGWAMGTVGLWGDGY